MHHYPPSEFDDTIARITDLIFIASPLRPVDIALVLGSPNPTSSYPAIALFRAGMTNLVAVTGQGRGGVPEWQIHRDTLVANGVPEGRILIEPQATNTLENFTLSARLIEERVGWSKIQTLALCCKPLHARRALLTARTHLPAGLSISVHCPKDPMDIQADTWWQSPRGRMRVMGELSRIGDYAQSGDIQIMGPGHAD